MPERAVSHPEEYVAKDRRITNPVKNPPVPGSSWRRAFREHQVLGSTHLEFMHKPREFDGGGRTEDKEGLQSIDPEHSGNWLEIISEMG